MGWCVRARFLECLLHRSAMWVGPAAREGVCPDHGYFSGCPRKVGPGWLAPQLSVVTSELNILSPFPFLEHVLKKEHQQKICFLQQNNCNSWTWAPVLYAGSLPTHRLHLGVPAPGPRGRASRLPTASLPQLVGPTRKQVLEALKLPSQNFY